MTIQGHRSERIAEEIRNEVSLMLAGELKDPRLAAPVMVTEVRPKVLPVAGETAVTVAASLGRTHPVVALWPVSLRGELRGAVADDGIRRIDRFTGRYSCAVEQWAADPVDPFFNVDMNRFSTGPARGHDMLVN